MAIIDPLDRVPKVPQDWANHVVYGGALGLVCVGIFRCIGLPEPGAAGVLSVLIVAAFKKGFDFAEEGESALTCIGKTVVTAIWPATFLLFGA